MRPIGIGISSPQAPEHKQLSSPEQLAQQGPLLMQVVASVSYLGNAMSTRNPATYHSHTETHTHRAWVSLNGDVVVEDGKPADGLPLLDAEKESEMAKPTQSESGLSLDRRQLLASAAVITTAGLAPIAESAGAANPAQAASAAKTWVSANEALNVCASTARKIEEVAERNRIREQAGLPLLSIPRELRRMKNVDDAAEFEEFANLHRQAVWEEVLAPSP
jgi:hypothetical protein